MNKNKGFTLIEILTSSLLMLIIFFLVYRTYFTVQKNIKDIQKSLKENEILFNFLYFFKGELNQALLNSNFKFNRDEITFITLIENIESPVEITYSIKNDEKGKTLIRRQKNIFTGYSFSLPIISCEDINFIFYDEGTWKEVIESDKIPQGIAIEIKYKSKKIFFPVSLNIKKKSIEKDEKK